MISLGEFGRPRSQKGSFKAKYTIKNPGDRDTKVKIEMEGPEDEIEEYTKELSP